MINKVTLLGRIGTKEFKQTKNGGHICLLSIATKRNYIDAQGQKREFTTWHNVNLFNRIAEVGNKYANVGDLIYVEGEIVNKKIGDPNDPTKTRFIHSITGSEIKLIPTGRKPDENKSEPNGNVIDDSFDDEIPF
jgi:single-strand DNA-binding protein